MEIKERVAVCVKGTTKSGSIVVALSLFALLAGSAFADQPNFVLLLSDDQDWTGLSVQMHPDIPTSKSDFYQTPNMARLASEGMRFSAGYAPSAVCSPTRISLQTGKSPAQLHWTKASPVMTAADRLPLIPPPSRKNITADETTIAEMLKTAGYATAHYGKWHLGGGGPQGHGYDESDGDTGNNDAAPHKADNPVDIFGMGRRAAAFMETQAKAGKPFYVQMSYHALHYPENASPETLAKYEKLPPGRIHRDVARAAITEDLDRGVGLLLEKLDALGLAKHTYVIYMSDNGGGGGRGGGGGSAGGGGRPVAGGKGSVWEGGIRVPFIVRGPGIEPGSWCRERVVGYDWFPTLCALAGVKEPLPAGVEGGDISHLLAGGSGPVRRPREELVFHFPHYQGDTPHSAILLGDFKLMKFYETGETRLFQISGDIGEGHDLAGQMPEKAAELAARLDAHLAAVCAALPVVNPAHVEGTAYRKKEGKAGRAGKSGDRKRRLPPPPEPRATD